EILVKTANEYVEKFVEDVDRAKVLTARHGMTRPETVNMNRHGPRVALERMRAEGLSSILVVDHNRKLQGYVTTEDVVEARDKEGRDLHNIIQTNIQQVCKDTASTDTFPLIHDTPIPIAVTDKEEKLVGSLVRGAVIAGLAKEGSVNEDD